MIAKGLDFPNVSLVGVISADTSLHLPDFNSAERTFQLLTQVSGRAGRGDIPGEVIVQSFSPEHYAIQAAANHDYEGFYRQEIAFREELGYPPFSSLINVVSTDPVDGYAESRLREWVSRLDLPVGVEILGPAECPLSKLKGLYRWHVVLKDRSDNTELKSIIRASAPLPGLTFDVDPLSML
jgi:primosomal protein N' (replication factor Y)